MPILSHFFVMNSIKISAIRHLNDRGKGPGVQAKAPLILFLLNLPG